MYKKNIKIRNLGLRRIQDVCSSMNDFTITRKISTPDEIWLVQHYPVFTIGVSGTKHDVLVSNNIPIIFSNRGGKITYHAPGQLIIYVLINLFRRKLTVRRLILLMQNIIISTLKSFSIDSYILNNFPGVYVNNKKICSLGLRIRNGCSFHGMALNINMDLLPFEYINPCGNSFKMTQVIDIKPNLCFKIIKLMLMHKIREIFS
ncbi:lipoate-protein ligase B [Buchnera aphidicola str. Bp (Baizongia pistaciae)]|uniref:Octanoyltransferase n=1 Tax=Buchnera aphidicola subsp. Baizongia pistaciae (strain Bp) TaxID=224915 RepID=LIPB_BUCBP|nr:lipoyl(octanoyl) transferase LipB [Buchnera aphidicola]Q89AL8.1 RecName: Full=Octanoyltransferase; AltName: Full=Lipoate-protein ligase B; AltName: Full=Lipoyl/octanoyl transferase; AltName: Full=Octanoyl-[acyl-carrier-protein]-protein N-octanoyltransferase [Buchnera aphidicola str. Bp (Baizongia pistaciae)]AAO26976.1 lipoate-protein ligase B [Buchnera aphidicola str. Bp (Baizongia pistaciae)]